MLFTRELARRLDGSGIIANCIHPGLVATELMRAWPKWLRLTWEWALRTPEHGARPIVRLAASPGLAGVSGAYFVRERRTKFPRRARSDPLAADLWNESARLVGLD
jgi:NAD(P)-dependent dehydrogenase (short-subunit alcohol dehydrogenase family)